MCARDIAFDLVLSASSAVLIPVHRCDLSALVPSRDGCNRKRGTPDRIVRKRYSICLASDTEQVSASLIGMPIQVTPLAGKRMKKVSGNDEAKSWRDVGGYARRKEPTPKHP